MSATASDGCRPAPGVPDPVKLTSSNFGGPLVVDADGNLYLSVLAGETPTGTPATIRLASDGTTSRVAAGGLLTMDRHCNLYVAGADRVDRIGPNGDVSLAATQERVTRAAVTADGTLYTLGDQETLSRVSADGQTATVINDRDAWQIDDVVAAADGNGLVLAEYDTIERYEPDTGARTRIAGSGEDPGKEGRATAAQLHENESALLARTWRPSAVAVDTAGNVYLSVDGRVRRVGVDGIISTVAGGGPDTQAAMLAGGDGGPATLASLWNPGGIVVGADHTMYILELGARVRRVTPDGIISTIAGSGPAPWPETNPAVTASPTFATSSPAATSTPG